ncbi:MAG: sigma-70 family RNA polymerase sigma factor [Bacteroidales bacterium]|nr:sigma-70 family RNA polymerase sigma factor [Bacteroidales bacterium]
MTNEQQFLELLNENKQRIVSVCRYYASMNASLTVKDLFQEISLNLWKSYPKYVKRSDCQLSTWVYRVALNVSISQSRKKDNQVHQPINEEIAGISESCSEQEQVQQLYQLIQKLNQEDQALIYLYLDDKSHKEIADIMGISVSNVGTKIQRIKLKLKQLSNG